jgi:Synaptonemal complex 2 Spt16M-like domain
MWKTGVHTLTCNKLMIGKHQLHNPESEYLPNLYVDFSKVSQSINFFGVQNEGTLKDSNPLVFVKILKHQIKSSFLMAKEKPSYQLTLVLEKPLDNLSNTKYRSETCIIMNVNTDNIDILKNVIGVKLEVTQSSSLGHLSYFFLR